MKEFAVVITCLLVCSVSGCTYKTISEVVAKRYDSAHPGQEYVFRLENHCMVWVTKEEYIKYSIGDGYPYGDEQIIGGC